MTTSANILPDLKVVTTVLSYSTPLRGNCTHLYAPYSSFYLLSIRYDYIALSSELTRTAPRSLLPFSSSLVSSSVCPLILLLYLLYLFSPLIITERDTAALPTLAVSRIYRYIKSLSSSNRGTFCPRKMNLTITVFPGS